MTNRARGDALAAVGDIMLGDSAITVGFGFHSRHPRDLSPAFSRIAPLLRRADVAFGNLECVLVRAGKGSTRLRADQMRGDPSYAAGLRQLGFTALGVANNHATQHGEHAFAETVQHLRAAGIAAVGLRGTDSWCADPVIQETRSGRRIGLLGYCWRPRQYDRAEPPYAEGEVEDVERDVRRLREMTDTVLVSLHWGEEFVATPSTTEVATARRIVDAGAALIIGHHPHVVRPIEQYGNGLICYSLGNAVTDMLWQPELREGAILECRVEGDEISDVRVSRTRVDDACRVVIHSAREELGSEPVTGMDDGVYRDAVEDAVRRQRVAAYSYAARHFRRYPLPVLVELVATTLRNKVAQLASRLIGARPPSAVHGR